MDTSLPMQSIDWKLNDDGTVMLTVLDSHDHKCTIRVKSDYPIFNFYVEIPEDLAGWSSFEKEIRNHCKTCSDLMIKHLLYGEEKKMVLLQFDTIQQLQTTKSLLKSGFLLPGIGTVKLRCFEAEVDPITKLLARYNLTYRGWLTLPHYIEENTVNCKDLKQKSI